MEHIFNRIRVLLTSMPTVPSGTHRGKVCSALSKSRLMDCYDVAEALGWSVEDASTMLSDINRPGHVKRRPSTKKERENVKYEYQLKSNVSID
jgi:hypothetical protein